MRRKLQELSDTVSAFVDQADHLTLVLGADDASMPALVKTLEGLDQNDPADVFLMFPDDAGAPEEYLTAIAARLEVQRALANAQLQEQGKPLWPELPVACHDARLPARARLAAGLEWLRALMPRGDHRIVWALLPLAIHDQVGYARVVGQLIPREPLEPWMRGTRFLVRDEREAPFLMPALRRTRAPGVLLYEADFSGEAMEKALVDEALDPQVPVPERMASLLQLASLDYAHGRFPEAIEKYGILLAYHREQGSPEMQALSWQGIGDILRRTGRPAEARTRYEQGLLLVADSQALIITLNLCVALGDVCVDLEQLEDADGYFELADRIASKLVNPYVKTDCMEKRGLIRLERDDLGGAVMLWRDAAQLCRQFEYRHRLIALLEHLRAAYREAGGAGAMTDELDAVESELGALKNAKVPS